MIAKHAGRNRKTAHSYQHRRRVHIKLLRCFQQETPEVDIVCFIHHINYKLAVIQPFLQEFKEGSKNIVFTIAGVKAVRSARCK